MRDIKKDRIYRFSYKTNVADCQNPEIPDFSLMDKEACHACVAATFLKLPCVLHSNSEDCTVTIKPPKWLEFDRIGKDFKRCIQDCRKCIQLTFNNDSKKCVKISGGRAYIIREILLGYENQVRSIEFPYDIVIPESMEKKVIEKRIETLDAFASKMEVDAKDFPVDKREGRAQFSRYVEKEKEKLLHFFKSGKEGIWLELLPYTNSWRANGEHNVPEDPEDCPHRTIADLDEDTDTGDVEEIHTCKLRGKCPFPSLAEDCELSDPQAWKKGDE